MANMFGPGFDSLQLHFSFIKINQKAINQRFIAFLLLGTSPNYSAFSNAFVNRKRSYIGKPAGENIRPWKLDESIILYFF